MVWSVLAHDADEVRSLYAGKPTVSGFEFLDDILTGAKSDWDEISEADLLDRIRSWIASDEVEGARESRPALNTTKLVDEVRRLADADRQDELAEICTVQRARFAWHHNSNTCHSIFSF